MPDVKVGRRAQVVIPARIRRELGIEEGDTLRLEVDDHGRLILEQVPDDPLSRVASAGRGCYEDVDPLAVQEELRSEWDR